LKKLDLRFDFGKAEPTTVNSRDKMTKFNGVVIAAALGLMTALPQTAAAEVKIYPYKSSANYCPTGFQPVSINGVICCGKPNTHTSYQSAMAHPVAKKKVHQPRQTYRARSQCVIGTKGCTFD
jgi:hypothetical protein